MAPLSTDAISHFTHPAHKLNLLTTNSSFLCDGCKLPGTGSRFTCTICSFDLHDYCAICPARLTSTTNHHHPMSLVVHKPQPNQTQSCQSCHNPIKGLAYVCNSCSLWIHPLCVSYNAGQSPPTSAASASGSASVTDVASSIGSQIAVGTAVGVGKSWIFDQIKEHSKSHLATSNSSTGAGASPSASFASNTVGVDEDGVGIFDEIMSGFLSLFESSSA